MYEDDSETQAWHTPERPSATRRDWIRSAGGGLLLAAGGLFLPERPEEASARPAGAYGGTVGGRHGPNARGRDKRKRRDHGDKKDRDRGNDDRPRGGGTENIFVGVRYDRNGLPPDTFVDITFYTLDSNDKWVARASNYLRPQETTTYKSDVKRVRVYVRGNQRDRRYVEFENPFLGFPFVRIYDPNRDIWDRWDMEEGKELLYKDSSVPFSQLLKIKRNRDTPGYKNFVIDAYVDGIYCPTCRTG